MCICIFNYIYLLKNNIKSELKYKNLFGYKHNETAPKKRRKEREIIIISLSFSSSSPPTSPSTAKLKGLLGEIIESEANILILSIKLQSP